MEVTDVFAINETRKSEGETNDEIKGDVVQEDTAETENGSSSDLTRDDETEADSSEIETEPPVTENISVLVKETTETHTSSAAEPDTANKQGVAQGSIAIDEVRNNIVCSQIATFMLLQRTLKHAPKLMKAESYTNLSPML